MSHTLFTASAAIISLVSPPIAASAQCIRRIDIGGTRDVEVHQTGIVTAIATCPTPRARSHGAVQETDPGMLRQHGRLGPAGTSVNDQAGSNSCAGSINGQVSGEVTLGSNVKIRVARQGTVGAVAIAGSAACNANGVLATESC